jgi:hypothetical protein
MGEKTGKSDCYFPLTGMRERYPMGYRSELRLFPVWLRDFPRWSRGGEPVLLGLAGAQSHLGSTMLENIVQVLDHIPVKQEAMRIAQNCRLDARLAHVEHDAM